MIRDLVITLEEYGFQYGKNLKNNPNDRNELKNHSNVQLHVQYIKRGNNLSKRETFKFPNASFSLLPNALATKSDAVVVVLWYKTINSLLRNGDQIDGKLNSKIITASVQPEPETFAEPVRISWNVEELVIQVFD